MIDESAKLRGKMAELKVTQSELAERLGCTRSNISHKMKRGYYSLEDMREIANALNVKVSEIFNVNGGD